MSFIDFLKERKVKRAKVDYGLINSLVKTSRMDLKFLNSLKINEFSARKVMSGYYDVLRSILEAVCLKRGFKVYSHEAFSFFLVSVGEDILGRRFERIRRIRDSINYYGKEVSVLEVRANVSEMKLLIRQIYDKFLKEDKKDATL